jgi:hypothetical protein
MDDPYKMNVVIFFMQSGICNLYSFTYITGYDLFGGL